MNNRTLTDPKPYQPGTARGVTVVPARCALTIDVEDWYQSCIDLEAPISSRVVRNVDRVLALLDECGVKASFFVQGRVAETFPSMLEDILAAGHEIQSHGYSHRSLSAMDRRQLRTELERARKSVEDACGVAVTSFRAPDFTIARSNLWALEVLAEAGFRIDSSVFPMRTRRYGIRRWEKGPQRVSLPNNLSIWEVPVAVASFGLWPLPVAGGGYFRLLPRWLIGRALRSILEENRPVVLYCHPYEFNPEELRDYRGRAPASFLLRQSLGRGYFVERIRQLLRDLPFARFDEVLSRWGIPSLI